MKFKILFLSVVIIVACNNKEQSQNETAPLGKEVSKKELTEPEKKEPQKENAKIYDNKRFRNVRVQKTDDTTFRITGQGQIFEANFNYVVEDGHNELLSGYHMTDAGAPEWGNFDFTIAVKKQRPNSMLHLILYEVSTMDGSRTHELAIPLPE